MNQLAHPVTTDAGKARFSTAEFMHMAALGAFDDMKVELVDGEIERMNPPMSGHASRQASISIRLAAAIDSRRIIGEIGIDLGDDSVLACDAAIIRRDVEGNRLLTADDLELVIEIAQTTLDRDMGMKRRKYAAAGIPVYWVIDNTRRVTHVFARPIDGDYADIATVAFDAPLEVPTAGATIVVD